MSLIDWSLTSGLAAGFCLAATAVLHAHTGADLAAVAGPASAVTGALLFLVPTALELRFTPARCAAAAALGAGIWLVVVAVSGAATASPVTAAAIALMIYFCAATGSLLAPIAGSVAAAMAWITFFTVLLASTPVWLGFLIDLSSPGREVVDALIAINPLTHLAAGTQTDYLRSDWLYRHSPVGGLRYDYPSSTTILAAYLLACLSASIAASHAGRRTRNTQAGRRDAPWYKFCSLD